MEAKPALASWLVAQRAQIERRMRGAMRPASPRTNGPEAETLRRFRSFTSMALHTGEVRPPALDGLTLNERRMGALLDAWLTATCELAGPDADEVRSDLAPLVEQFRSTIRQSASGRSARGKPRAARRAVVAAIDRVADAFLAIDTVTDAIVDANPAAGALLGTPRDTLLGLDIGAFATDGERSGWRARLDAMAEGGDHARFDATLADVGGRPVRVEVSLTAFPTRGRTIALALCRPAAAPVERRAEARPADDASQAGSGEEGGAPGFVRLADGKPVPRRGNGLRRGAGRRTPAGGAMHPPTPPR